jgi:hypothetical protein
MGQEGPDPIAAVCPRARACVRGPGGVGGAPPHTARAEVDELLEKCRKRQQQDARIEIKEYEDLVAGPVTVHAFYVRDPDLVFLGRPAQGPAITSLMLSSPSWFVSISTNCS